MSAINTHHVDTIVNNFNMVFAAPLALDREVAERLVAMRGRPLLRE